MQTIRVAEHFDRTEKVKRPDWWYSNDKDTARALCDRTRMSIGTCSLVSGVPAHGHEANHEPCLATTRRLPDRDLSSAFDREGHHQWRYCATVSHTILTEAISTEKRASSERSISGEKPTCQA
jgi:hypothetical protein